MRHLAALALLLVGIAACEDGPDGAPPPGEFACGSDFCDLSTQICIHESGGDTCQNAPAACNGAPSCSCASTCAGGSCQAGSDGSVTVTCGQ